MTESRTEGSGLGRRLRRIAVGFVLFALVVAVVLMGFERIGAMRYRIHVDHLKNAGTRTLNYVDAGPESVAELFVALQEPDVVVRINAARALATVSVDDTRSVHPELKGRLWDALQDQDPQVRAAARAAIDHIYRNSGAAESARH